MLCKELVASGALCAEGKLWPKGSIIRALAEKPKFISSLAFYCEDSVLEGETTAAIGSSLPIKFTKLDFGVLPTPTLGKGCLCGKEWIHAALPFTGAIGVGGEDSFFVAFGGEIAFEGCVTGFSCAYSIESPEARIVHGGTHPLDPGRSDLPVIEIEAPMKAKSPLCWQLATWQARYVVTAVESGGEKGLGWPALDL